MSVVHGIARNAAELFAVPFSEIIGSRQHRRVLRARFAVAWASRRKGISSPVIGRMLGRRDHSTILNAERRADEWRAADPEYRRATDALLTGDDWCCPHCGGNLA